MANKSWIQSRAGHKLYPMTGAGEIELSDIAGALSKMNRYAGHTKVPYSVCQHAINCARVAPAQWKLWALHHDDPEYVLTDIPRPMKHMRWMKPYHAAERKWMRRIAGMVGLQCNDPGWWGTNDPVPPEVKLIDNRMLATEAQYLFDKLHPEWQHWIEGIEPYPLPRESFISYLPPSFFESEWLGLHAAYKWSESCS